MSSKLINCPACNRPNVSEDAAACPGCGHALKTIKKEEERKLLMFLLIILVLFYIAYVNLVD
jgi:uncharacterized paraquat-inducible protein A